MDNKGWLIALLGWIGRPRVLFVALTLVLAAGIIWAAKPSERRIKIYNSVEACRAEQPAEECAKAFADAEQEHEKSAPRSTSREVCEAQYGTCSAFHDATGDWFVPAMVGFMIGHALGAGGATTVVSQPVYVGRDLMAYSGTTVLGSYRSRCAVNPDDPYCRAGGGSGGGGGFVYARGGSGGGSSSSSSVWSSRSYRVEEVRTTVMRGGFGHSSSSAPSYSAGGADAPHAFSSAAVARGGFGSTASAHGVGE
jgi:uncharacterized protein YgiB involved in biofilm formation